MKTRCSDEGSSPEAIILTIFSSTEAIFKSNSLKLKCFFLWSPFLGTADQFILKCVRKCILDMHFYMKTCLQLSRKRLNVNLSHNLKEWRGSWPECDSVEFLGNHHWAQLGKTHVIDIFKWLNSNPFINWKSHPCECVQALLEGCRFKCLNINCECILISQVFKVKEVITYLFGSFYFFKIITVISRRCNLFKQTTMKQHAFSLLHRLFCLMDSLHNV